MFSSRLATKNMEDNRRPKRARVTRPTPATVRGNAAGIRQKFDAPWISHTANPATLPGSRLGFA